MVLIGPAIGSVLFAACLNVFVSHTAPKVHRLLVCWLNHLHHWLGEVAMLPMLKLGFTFFQTMSFMPVVCTLPGLEPWLFDPHLLNPTTGVRIPVRQMTCRCQIGTLTGFRSSAPFKVRTQSFESGHSHAAVAS